MTSLEDIDNTVLHLGSVLRKFYFILLALLHCIHLKILNVNSKKNLINQISLFTQKRKHSKVFLKCF